jgi:magnesium-protoporphyrin O-methyltransferase
LEACCNAIDAHFSAEKAAGLESDLHSKGLAAETDLLATALLDAGVVGLSVIDVGAGIGALAEKLLGAGAQQAVLVDISAAYLEAAKRRLGSHSGKRVEFLHGDITELASKLDDSDIVTLDKVICCYPDARALISSSTKKARRYYAASYPRDRWLVRLAIWFENTVRRLRGNPFRAYVHSVDSIEELMRKNGFQARAIQQTFFWRCVLFARSNPRT